MACPVTGPLPAAMCAQPTEAPVNDGLYSLILTTGTWQVEGFYQLALFSGSFVGTPHVVTLTRPTTHLDLVVPFRKAATVSGVVTVAGIPDAFLPTTQGYGDIYPDVLLCPSFAPYTGGAPSWLCVTDGTLTTVTEGNDVKGPYQVTDLPPGPWLVYPGFCDEFGACPTYNPNADVALQAKPGGSAVVNVATPFLLPGEGAIVGTVTLLGAPPGFEGGFGVEICPAGSGGCLDPGAPAPSFTYGDVVASGRWDVRGFYNVPPYYNLVLGPTAVVTVKSGSVTTVNVVLHYQPTGNLRGSINVTGAPQGVHVDAYTMLACPASQPWTGGSPEVGCVSEVSGPDGYGYGPAGANRLRQVPRPGDRPAAEAPLVSLNRYVLDNLPWGRWILYPGYETAFGAYLDPTGTAVTVEPSATVTRNVSLPYQPPTEGLVAGTLDVIGAVDTYGSGVEACSTPPTAVSCTDEYGTFVNGNGTYDLPLPPGTWYVAGYVYDSVPPGEALSATHQVTVVAGVRDKLDLVVNMATGG